MLRTLSAPNQFPLNGRILIVHDTVTLKIYRPNSFYRVTLKMQPGANVSPCPLLLLLHVDNLYGHQTRAREHCMACG